MVKTVAHCVKIKINQMFPPATNFEIRSRKLAKLGEHYVLSFCRNLRGQKLIKLQYDTVEIFVIISTDVRSELDRMVPAKQSSKVCNFYIKYNGEIVRVTT